MKVANQTIKKIVRLLLPLEIRKRLAIWVNRQIWLGDNRRSWWAQELIRDFIKKDINDYHKFLWANHLTYASSYEVEQRFGEENMKESRRMFFFDFNSLLTKKGFLVNGNVKSIFEVGCSLGYQLRYLETNLFTGATVFEGIDIDRYAIQKGTEFLKSIGSKVRLKHADMEEFDAIINKRNFDIIICTGVLMYLNEKSATRLVNKMLKHSNVLLAISDLAHPENDNSQLPHSDNRDNDMTFIHNIDSMVKEAGGKVIARRWEGRKLIDGHTIYFVFASSNEK